MNASSLIKTKLEPGRPVYVLLHKDGSHMYAKEQYEVLWSYEQGPIDLVRKILIKDFNNRSYSLMTLKEALVIVGNTQAKLMTEWKPIIKLLRSTKKLEDRLAIYKRASKKGPHPLELDSMLRKLLAID